MKKYLTLFLAALAFTVLSAQTPQIGTAAWQAQNSQYLRQGGPAVNPLNGNDTLTQLYNNTACGLNYTMSSVRLGQRFVPIGLPQPAAMPVTLPGCATIDKAYLYTEVLGVAPSVTANLTNPASVTTSYSMTLIGSSIDVCWGYNGTHVWRADVTSSITGSGNYMISGLPTNTSTSCGSCTDVEGATLVIIYMDGTVTSTGSLVLEDGCKTVAGGQLSHTMTGFSACANSTSGSAFMLVGDMQMPGYTINMNNTAATQPPWNWWNEIVMNTSVTNGQNTCNYDMDGFGDCYTLAVAGLYFQTGCQTCTPSSTNMSTTTSFTAANCGNNGSASVNVTGGSGNYTYMWSPGGQTTSTAANLAAGTYTVNIQDGISCTSAIVTVPYTGMTLSTSATPYTCISLGSATVSISGGTGPFTYSWAPSGGTNATASNLAAGSYTVTVTDTGTGCTMTDTAVVANNGNIVVQVGSTPDSCPSPSGSIGGFASGGQAPYTYLWMPGNYTTANVYNVAAGTYTLTVTDAAGCSATGQTTVGTITSSFYVWTGNVVTVGCGDSTLMAIWCNDPSATFSWSPGTYLNSTTSQSPVCTPSGPITYTVTATGQCGTATDTIQVSIDSTNYHVEQICFVTVDTATTKNIVVWERWNTPSGGFYNIYRETSVSNVYALIASQPVSQFSTYIDVTSNPLVMANRYKITTTDTCGIESDTSYHHRTIHLQTSPTGNGGWNLAWTAYEGLPIQTYNIFRGTSISTLTLLTTVAGNVFTYTDLTPPAGQNYYMIEAVHPFGGCTPARLSHTPSLFEYASSISNYSLAIPNGVEESGLLENSLVIAPNPGSGTFQLGLSLSNPQEVNVIVLDQLGRTVHTQTASGSKGTNTIAMNLEGLSAGVYFVQVNTPNGTATRRLVIE